MPVALPGLLAMVLRCLAVVLGLSVALRGLLPIALLPVALGCGALSVAGLSVALGCAGGVRSRRRRGSIA